LQNLLLQAAFGNVYQRFGQSAGDGRDSLSEKVRRLIMDLRTGLHAHCLEQELEEQAEAVELSIVMPCLNEADTLETCVRKAQRALRDNDISGEIIIADNGSTDGSQAIASELGARLVHVEAKGYGSALMGGINAARGKYVIMGDADDSYDFLETPKFVEKLRQGYDLVQGCRLPSGGGRVMPGAMPFLHRWWGNPMFSSLSRVWFRAPIHDVYCGLRGFTQEHYRKLDQRCTGMEFATEMIIKSSLYKAKIAEVPITLHPDGRKAHAPHLKTFRDGWRTLRFFLLYSPRWLFLLPGALLIILGLTIGLWLLPGPRKVGNITFDVHTLLYAAAAILLGFQAVSFALFTKIFAISEGLLPEDKRLNKGIRFINLETGLIVGVGLILVGLAGSIYALEVWSERSFGQLNSSQTLRTVIPAMTCLTLGCQVVFSSFFLSVLGLKRR
jgi:glycosyltransferase involved in cell wall biosynthesis